MGWIKIAFLLVVFAVLLAFIRPKESFSEDLVKGRRVLVTGASSGIGEQLAYKYAERGASVFITARREARLQKVVEKCKELGTSDANFGYVVADMGELTQTRNIINAAVDVLGGLDQIIINHALIQPFKLWSDDQERFDELKKMLDVNTIAPAQLAIQAVPYLKETNGSIAVVSSLAGKIGLPLIGTYCASKHALNGFFEGLRSELLPSDISVTIATIGGIDTDAIPTVLRNEDGKLNIEAGKMDSFPYGTASDCAYEIMRGTTMREEDVYFPFKQLIKPIVMTRDFTWASYYMGKGMMNLLKDTR